jgi:hypothetical protein
VQDGFNPFINGCIPEHTMRTVDAGLQKRWLESAISGDPPQSDLSVCAACASKIASYLATDSKKNDKAKPSQTSSESSSELFAARLRTQVKHIPNMEQITRQVMQEFAADYVADCVQNVEILDSEDFAFVSCAVICQRQEDVQAYRSNLNAKLQKKGLL